MGHDSFALGTAKAQPQAETRTPQPTDTPALPLTGTPRSNLATQIPTLLPTTVSPAAPEDETIAALITLTCLSHGVADVQVAVGQVEGGQRGTVVTLKTDTDNLEEVASVVEAVLRAVHKVNTGDVQADLDFVSIVVGDAAGMAAMTVTVPMTELEAWMAGEITHKEFIATWVIKDF
jgi:putative NIF3 family GTP cyclohydrolase 1 type 2